MTVWTLEREHRFSDDTGSFTAPAELAGLPQTGDTRHDTLEDRYLDTADLRLLAVGCTLRRSVRPSGQELCIKRCLEHRVDDTVVRAKLCAPERAERRDEHPAELAARRLVGPDELLVIARIDLQRTMLDYAGPTGRLLLSVERVGYRHGPAQRRVEVELAHGSADLLDRAAAQLLANGLAPCRRSKAQEALARAGNVSA